MSLRRDFRIKRLLSRYDRALAPERDHLYAEIRNLLVEARDEAVEHNRYSEYCTYATALGQLFLEGPDPSDALRPFGCAYVTACSVGDRLNNQRVAAAEGLTAAYAKVGDYEFAAECAYEAIASAGRETDTIAFQDVLIFLANVGQVDAKDTIIRQIYDTIRPELEHARAEWANPMRAIIDARLRLVPQDYESLVSTAGILTGPQYKDFTWTAHQAFAAAALAEDRIQEAAKHVDHALDHMDMDNAPWLKAPLLGLSAKIRHAAGDGHQAFDLSMQGWATVLPALLWCKDDYARRSVQLLANACIDTAITIAYERREWPVLTELIENSRLQAAAGSVIGADARAAEGVPNWIIDRFVDALLNHSARAGLQAVMTGDWKSSLSDQIIASHQGQSAVAEALERNGVDLANRNFSVVEAFESLRNVLDAGAVVWAAVVRNETLFWTLSDADGSFHGGALELGASDVGRSLSALRALVLSDQSESIEGAGGINELRTDPLRALADEGSPDELELMCPLTKLIPSYLTTVALRRSSEEPLQVFFVMPPELSCVPWAVVPLSAPNFRVVRLVERIELHVITPTAVRARAAKPRHSRCFRRIVVSCCNPTGDLLPWPPVDADIVLDGNSLDEGGVPLERFLQVAEELDPPPDSVLFIRSHLSTGSSTNYIADQGIAFMDGVLSARSLNLREEDGTPVCRLPGRVVLALCSGAGSADASGLVLGLAAACRLAGAEEVVTTLFDVIDSAWSCELDHRLAEIAVRPEPLATSLRTLQLECLSEWRSAAVTASEHSPDEGPTPFTWAAYGVVN